MQNIFVMRDPLAPMDPCAWVAQPANASIYWNDQQIQWKLLIDPSSGANWDPAHEPPIVFASGWEGTEPSAVPDPFGPVPFYQATGAGGTPIAPQTFQYTIYLDVPECVNGKVTISAAITNQPKM